MTERNPDGTFKKGVSGNPAGRPPKKSFAEYFDEEEKEALINRIKEELNNKKVKGDILKLVVEHIFGKPKQPLVGGDDDDKPIAILNNVVPSNDSNKENSGTTEEN